MNETGIAGLLIGSKLGDWINKKFLDPKIAEFLLRKLKRGEKISEKDEAMVKEFYPKEFTKLKQKTISKDLIEKEVI